MTVVAFGGHGLWDVGCVGLGFGGSLSGGDLVFNSFFLFGFVGIDLAVVVW